MCVGFMTFFYCLCRFYYIRKYILSKKNLQTVSLVHFNDKQLYTEYSAIVETETLRIIYWTDPR